MVLNEEKINDLMIRVINENMEYRNEMLEKLLIHTLRSETLVLLSRKLMMAQLLNININGKGLNYLKSHLKNRRRQNHE